VKYNTDMLIQAITDLSGSVREVIVKDTSTNSLHSFDDLPARTVFYPNSRKPMSMEWYKFGSLFRSSGPAVIHYSNSGEIINSVCKNEI